MKTPSVLIVGGAGYIGSHVNKILAQAGYQTVVFDNLSKGSSEAVTRGTFIKGDMGNPEDLEALFKSYRFDAVMHFAAFIDVGESITDPAKYYINNVAYTLNLLQAMRRHGVNYFILSSTAAVYGIPQQPRIDETHPCLPINPYGHSKKMVEQFLRDMDTAHGLKFCSLRYFNAAGGDPEGEVKNYKSKESNLIPLALRSLKQPGTTLTINGTDYDTPDGTCIRDYIHVHDLGAAHKLALDQLLMGKPSTIYNLGNGQGFSVREVLHSIEKVTGKKLSVLEGPRRPGDPPILVADAQKALRELGWQPRYPALDTMVDHAWKAMSNL